MRISLLAVLFAGGFFVPAASARGAEPSTPKVAIIVGPVGAALTPHYLAWAESTAIAAEAAGAVVERAYSPQATPDRVLAAVKDANVVVYYGHGWGHPSPYASQMSPAKQNGWALNGPNSRDHSDSTSAATMVYMGGDWIRQFAHPAPGFTMIYAHTCYAPGAPDAPGGESTPAQARERAANYSAPAFDIGAAAYFANDFAAGAEGIVTRLLREPDSTFGAIFAADPRYYAPAVVDNPHPTLAGLRLIQQRSSMVISSGLAEDGVGGTRTDYFYAFAGDPTLSPTIVAQRILDDAAAARAARSTSDDRHLEQRRLLLDDILSIYR